MSDLSVSEWKTFLNARILQEEGQDEKALEAFEQLLVNHPDNQHLQSSRAFALERLGRGDEAVANRLAVKYAELGKTLVGGADKPDVWTTQLSSLLQEIDNVGVRGARATALVAW